MPSIKQVHTNAAETSLSTLRAAFTRPLRRMRLSAAFYLYINLRKHQVHCPPERRPDEEEDSMCSILGYCGKPASYEAMQAMLAKTISRGPDMSRIEPAGEGCLCFHRLAIMGLHPEGMQPFHLGGDACVCNGELYLFRPLKKRLEPSSTLTVTKAQFTLHLETTWKTH